MSLPVKTRQALEKLLLHGDEQPGRSLRGASNVKRLAGDAQRLWLRVQRLMEINLVVGDVDAQTLELACLALELPSRSKNEGHGKLGRTNMREHAEHAAHLLGELAGEAIEPELLARAIQVLEAMPNRAAKSNEARLLSDAVNLDDFGVLGLITQAVRVARQGGGVAEVAEGSLQRDAYGYWEARLKDGFHFAPVRQLALARLDHARSAAALLLAELDEDKPAG